MYNARPFNFCFSGRIFIMVFTQAFLLVIVAYSVDALKWSNCGKLNNIFLLVIVTLNFFFTY